MKLVRVIPALLLVFILVVTLTCSAFGAYNIVNAQKVGAGGLIVKGGDVRVQTAAGVDTTTITAATGNTSIGGTLAVTGASTIPIVPIVAETTAARTVTSADFGKTITCSYAGATTITLPNPSAGIVGATFLVAQTVDQNLTIVGGSTADNNNIIADGVATCDNVAFSTGSHKIGAMARVTCISATKWLITNASGCTMTVEAAD